MLGAEIDEYSGDHQNHQNECGLDEVAHCPTTAARQQSQHPRSSGQQGEGPSGSQ